MWAADEKLIINELGPNADMCNFYGPLLARGWGGTQASSVPSNIFSLLHKHCQDVIQFGRGEGQNGVKVKWAMLVTSSHILLYRR